jgi:hypothetical protein
MHPAQVMSYYPTYSILDEIVSFNNYDTLNIFVDLKNCLQSVYMEHTIINFIETTKMSGRYDTSIFTSLLAFISFHKKYATKRNIKINFYVFFESGISYYHNNISKKYKVSRRIDDLYGLDATDREMFYEILRQNFGFIEKAFSLMPDIKIIRLLNLEADFVPYYLMTRNYVDSTDDITTSSNVANITYSNDHDMAQNLMEHSYSFVKIPQGKTIYKAGQGMYRQTKRDWVGDDEYQPLAISILGDPGDDVDGIKGIGPVTFLKILPTLKKMVGTMDELNENVLKGKPIFDTSTDYKNKHINKILAEEASKKLISNNLKLVSFEILSRVFDDPDTTEMLGRKKRFEKIINETKSVSVENMRTVLEQHNVEMMEDDLDIVYL